MPIFSAFTFLVGENNKIETYFKLSSQANKSTCGKLSTENKMAALLSTSETGLVSIDRLTIDAAYALSIHPG